MAYQIKTSLINVEPAPISEAYSWVPKATGDRPFIQLSQDVPGYPPAESLQAMLAERTSLPQTSLYTDILGIPPLRTALADNINRDYGADTGPDNVAVTAGGNQAFCLAVMALASPGDNVILPEPCFFNHQMWLEMNGIEARFLACGDQTGMLPDPALAETLIDSRTRAIVLVTPNNPTGAIYPAPLIQAFFDLCEAHRIALLIDETYKDFRQTPQPAHNLFKLPDWSGTFIHLYSFSKVFSLTGYRIGAMVAGGDLISEIEKMLDCVAICAPRIGQDAALFGLRDLSAWKTEKQIEIATRLQAFRRAFSIKELDYELVTSGAFFAYVRHPFRGQDSFAVAKRLARHHGVLVLPGAMFGPGQDDYLRIAIANADAALMPEVAARFVESQAS